MRKISFSLLSFLVSVASYAGGPWNVEFQNLKLPSQALLEHSIKINPGATSVNGILNAVALSNGGAVISNAFLAQPDHARNVIITPGGSTGSVGAGNIIVSGTNILGYPISESLVVTAASNSLITGLKAFKSLTSVSFPAAQGLSASISVGLGNKVGLPHCMNQAGDYSWSEFGGVFDSTRGTVSTNATAVELNTFIPASTMDGAHNLDIFFVQNFRCF